MPAEARTSGEGGTPRAAMLLTLLLAAELAAFAISTISGVRAQDGFDPLLDGWLQGGAYVTAAVLCALRPVLVPADRRLWTFVAVALALRAAAFVVYLAHVREQEPIPYPSIADAGWLAMCAVLLVGLVDFARTRLRQWTPALVLDAVVGTLAITAVAVALLAETLRMATAPGTPTAAIATNIAYPCADVALLLVILGLLAGFDWAPPRWLWVLGAGVVGFAVLDSVFLYQVTAGTFRPATALSALSVAATCVIALAAWVPAADRMRDRPQLPGLVLPTVFAVTCLVVLVAAAVTDVPLGAVVLATAGLLVAIARTALTFREVRAGAVARREARTDELTGVANRRGFNERLAASVRGRDPARPLSLLSIDLDGFKDVNDSLGHHHGDELLGLVAARMRLGLRADDLLARIGGDEFAVVLDGASTELAIEVTQRLQAALRRPLTLAGRELVPEASVGIATFPEHGRDTTELLRNADLAMYDAKAARTGYRTFRPDHHHTARERIETVERLRRAIAEGEIVLHYQPQVSLATGAVVGYEALARWEHPEAGLLPPDRFLPQAERGGLMPLLSMAVLEQAVGQQARWTQGSRSPPIVAVNLSVTDLLDLEFPGRLADVLARHGVDGSGIVLELTEDLFMADPARGARTIAALRDIGVTIDVDDYGTGYSSLAYLHELRDVRGLKLDRSFVTHMDTDPRARAIVASTIALARSLDLVMIAEGVETEAVREQLAGLGCEIAQGYLFARPCPAAELAPS